MKYASFFLILACAGSINYVASVDKYADIKLDAHEGWLSAGVETTTSYSLEYLPEDKLDETCGHKGIDGCAKTNASAIYLKSGMNPQRQLVTLMHEVGHLTRGDGKHLKCLDKPGDNIMCEAAARNGSEPTKTDVKFITEK
jgi:hypothetical protein